MTQKKLSGLHKSLLILMVVLTPPFWLVFTDEGTRVSDTALLWLLGEEDARLDVTELDVRFTRDDIQQVYSQLDWQCGDQQTAFGQSLCAARIGTFNGFPSRTLTFFFADGRVSAAKVLYRERYHDQILGHYIGQLGQPDNVEAAIAEGPDADEVLVWTLDGGRLLMKKELVEDDESALVWLAGGA
jgi:hypothetical protein